MLYLPRFKSTCPHCGAGRRKVNEQKHPLNFKTKNEFYIYHFYTYYCRRCRSSFVDSDTVNFNVKKFKIWLET